MKKIVSNKNDHFSWRDLIRAIFYLMWDKKKPFIIWLSILFIVHFYTIIPPLILGLTVDFFTSYTVGDSLNSFYFYVVLLGVLGTASSFIRLSSTRKLSDLLTEMIYQTRVTGFEKLLTQSISVHNNENTGAKAQKIQNGVQSYRTMINLIKHDIFRGITTIIGISIVFAFLSPVYILFLIVYVTTFFIIVSLYYKQITELKEQQFKLNEKSSGSYIEGLGNILSIKASGAEKSFKGHIAKKETEVKQHSFNINRVYNNKWKTYQFFNGIYTAVFLLMIGHGVVTNTITVGAIVIFFGYFEKLLGVANSVLITYEQIINAKTGIGRMMPYFWTTQSTTTQTRTFPKKWDELILKNITFTYRNTKNKGPGVKNINLVITKNQKIGLVGKTGSGKSTLAKLLIGLYKPQSGKYTIGKTVFNKIKPEAITDNIAIVLQESEMFNLSLQENITLMRKVSATTLAKTIRIAQLEEVIAKLPNGLQTLIGEKGYHLSGGERQRVGIARAICRDPQIIIFDEATSSLDTRTESKIQHALEKELDQKTLIFIAHRISTLKNVDAIHVFKDGEIQESGNYTKLLQDNKSLFAQLYKEKK